MTRTLRRTLESLTRKPLRPSVAKATSPRNSIPISNCSPKKTSAAVFRPKRPIAEPDSSSAASNRQRKATAISAGLPVLDAHRPGSALCVSRDPQEIPVSPPSRFFRSPSASAPTPLSSRSSTPCSSSRSPTRTRTVCSRCARLISHLVGQNPVARQPDARSRMGKAVSVARAGRVDAQQPCDTRLRRASRRLFPVSMFRTTSSRSSALNRSWAALFFLRRNRKAIDRVVILSESLWRSRFNADPSLVGKSILIDGQTVTRWSALFLHAFRAPYGVTAPRRAV